MRIRRFSFLICLGVALAVILSVGVSTYWEHSQPTAIDSSKLMSALRAFSRDHHSSSTVSLNELIDGKYLAEEDVQAFAGMEVTISLRGDETSASHFLLRARMKDGSEVVLLQDGSTHQGSADQVSRILAQDESIPAQKLGTPK